MIKLREVEETISDEHRAAFNTVVNYAEAVAPILSRGIGGVYQNPEHPGTGLVLVDIGHPGKAQIASFVIGAIDPEGNPYTVFNRLAITEESSLRRIQPEQKEEKQFTGYLRFSEEAKEISSQIPGRVNFLKSPFEDDNRPIYRITGGQFQLIKHLLKGEGIDYEIVEWPEGVEKPFVMPPGF